MWAHLSPLFSPHLEPPSGNARSASLVTLRPASQRLGLAANRFLFVLEKATCLLWLGLPHLKASGLWQERDLSQLPRSSEMEERQQLRGLYYPCCVKGENSARLQVGLGPAQDPGSIRVLHLPCFSGLISVCAVPAMYVSMSALSSLHLPLA